MVLIFHPRTLMMRKWLIESRFDKLWASTLLLRTFYIGLVAMLGWGYWMSLQLYRSFLELLHSSFSTWTYPIWVLSHWGSAIVGGWEGWEGCPHNTLHIWQTMQAWLIVSCSKMVLYFGYHLLSEIGLIALSLALICYSTSLIIFELEKGSCRYGLFDISNMLGKPTLTGEECGVSLVGDPSILFQIS